MNVENIQSKYRPQPIGKEIIYQVLGQNLLPNTQFSGESWVFYPNSGCLFSLIVLFPFKTLPKVVH